MKRGAAHGIASGLLLLAFAPACRQAPSGEAKQSRSPAPLFEEIAEETGLKFHYFNGATGQFLFPEIAGGGVALIDYDNDGDLDVYLVQSTLLNPAKRIYDAVIPAPAGWKPGNRLFRNMLAETGKLQFVDVTGQSGTGYAGFGMGAARYVQGRRELNTRDLNTYLKRALGGKSPTFQSEILAPEDRARETIGQNLRRAEGIQRVRFRQQTGFDLDALAGGAIGALAASGHLHDDGISVRLTRQGQCVADAVIEQFWKKTR